MTTPADTEIPVGRPHVTGCDIEILVRDYDKLMPSFLVLRSGSIFQPWQPQDEGDQWIPITLGDEANEFDWGKKSRDGSFSWDGHFIRREDFFTKCQLL
jgi:hypothetical protein